MADPDIGEFGDGDAQDVAEVYDEDNTNIEALRQSRGEDAEQFEDLPDVFDSTRADGDEDDEDEDEEDFDEDDLEDENDEAWTRDPRDREERADDDEDEDLDDRLEPADPDEVDLEYAGDLMDTAGARSSAADMESDSLSDEDLRALHYKE
jgi:hypothetical protein